ncbi:MAG: tetratricopeptide repeat protein [Gammaproteobacteria bacterium]|nr:MAG: tetratricopeptide repeat protein [Gammaproteobacteria bacterium]
MLRLTLLLLLSALLGACTVPAERPVENEPQLALLTERVAIRRLLREGKPDLALLQLEPLLQKAPTDPELNDLAGQALIATGQPEAALAHFDRALQKRPQDPDLLVNRGVALCRLGQRQEAEQTFVRAATLPGMKHADTALVNAGLCARQAGDAERAGRFFRAALQANPRSAAALYHLARQSLVEGRPMQARTYILRYQDIGPKTPKSLLLTWLIGEASGDAGLQRQAAEALVGSFADSEEAVALREGRAAQHMGLAPAAAPPPTDAEDAATVADIRPVGAMLSAQVTDADEPTPPASRPEQAERKTPARKAPVAETQETKLMPAPEVVGLEWLQDQPDDHWTLQLAAGSNMKALQALRPRLDPKGEHSAIVPFVREGSLLYALIMGSYPERARALEARAALPAEFHAARPRRFRYIRQRLATVQSVEGTSSR